MFFWLRNTVTVQMGEVACAHVIFFLVICNCNLHLRVNNAIALTMLRRNCKVCNLHFFAIFEPALPISVRLFG